MQRDMSRRDCVNAWTVDAHPMALGYSCRDNECTFIWNVNATSHLTHREIGAN